MFDEAARLTNADEEEINCLKSDFVLNAINGYYVIAFKSNVYIVFKFLFGRSIKIVLTPQEKLTILKLYLSQQ